MQINHNISGNNISNVQHSTTFKPAKERETSYTSYKGEEVKDEVILTPKAKAEINIDSKLKQEVKEKLTLLGNEKYKEIQDSKNPKRTAYLELNGNELIETIINKGVNPPQGKKITYNLDQQDKSPLKKDYQHFKEINNQVERSTHITLTKKEDGSFNKDPHPIEEEKSYSWDELAPKNKNKLEHDSMKIEESKTPSSQTSKTEEVQTKQEAVAAPIESKEETQEFEERKQSVLKAGEDFKNIAKTGKIKEKPYEEALDDFSNFVLFYKKEDYKKMKDFPPAAMPKMEKNREILKGLIMENEKKSSNLNPEDKFLRLATVIISYNNEIIKKEGPKTLNTLDVNLSISALQLLNSSSLSQDMKDRELIEKADQLRKENKNQ